MKGIISIKTKVGLAYTALVSIIGKKLNKIQGGSPNLKVDMDFSPYKEKGGIITLTFEGDNEADIRRAINVSIGQKMAMAPLSPVVKITTEIVSSTVIEGTTEK